MSWLTPAVTHLRITLHRFRWASDPWTCTHTFVCSPDLQAFLFRNFTNLFNNWLNIPTCVNHIYFGNLTINGCQFRCLNVISSPEKHHIQLVLSLSTNYLHSSTSSVVFNCDGLLISICSSVEIFCFSPYFYKLLIISSKMVL